MTRNSLQQCIAMCLVFSGRMFRFCCSRCIVVFGGWLVVMVVYPSTAQRRQCFVPRWIWYLSYVHIDIHSLTKAGGGARGVPQHLTCGWLMDIILLLAHNDITLLFLNTSQPIKHWPHPRAGTPLWLQLQQRLPAGISPNKIRVFKKRRITNYWMARCYHLFATFCVYLHWFYSNINNCQLFSTTSCQTSACFVIMRKSVE